MKIRYWDAVNKQNLPYVWQHSKLIKVKGFLHDDYFFRKVVDTCECYERHEFLITAKLSQLYNIPENVTPVLHFSSQKEIEGIEEYIAWCSAEHKLVCFSLFCREQMELPTLGNWVFISGNSYNNVRSTMEHALKQRQKVYVEYFNHNRVLTSLPQALRHRVIPKQLVMGLVERDLLGYEHSIC